MSEPTAYVIPAELRAALINYMMSRPYAEVAQGVRALEDLKPCATDCACATIKADA